MVRYPNNAIRPGGDDLVGRHLHAGHVHEIAQVGGDRIAARQHPVQGADDAEPLDVLQQAGARGFGAHGRAAGLDALPSISPVPPGPQHEHEIGTTTIATTTTKAAGRSVPVCPCQPTTCTCSNIVRDIWMPDWANGRWPWDECHRPETAGHRPSGFRPVRSNTKILQRDDLAPCR
jgi:hypothetical protein